jgi:hypothetical protein
LADAAGVGLVVLNPSNGPGRAPDGTYRELIARLRQHAIEVVGYVSTGYGARSRAEVAAEAACWSRWYAVDGIFLDEVDTEPASLSYYRALADDVRALASGQGVVVLNPGAPAPEAYLELADVLLTFEGTWATYRNAFPELAAWVRRYPAGRFWHVVYDCPSRTAMQRAVALARARHAGWLFVTSASSANPYDRLPEPGYWSAELRAARRLAELMIRSGSVQVMKQGGSAPWRLTPCLAT